MRIVSRLGSREASHEKCLRKLGRIRISEISNISEIEIFEKMFCVFVYSRQNTHLRYIQHLRDLRGWRGYLSLGVMGLARESPRGLARPWLKLVKFSLY